MGDTVALWTALLAGATFASVAVSFSYQQIIQKQLRLHEQQLELQRNQFADYVRPMLVWDKCVKIDNGARWQISVRNVGREPALVRAGNPRFDLKFEGGKEPEGLTTDKVVPPQTCVRVAIVPSRPSGTITVTYSCTSPGKEYVHSNRIPDLVESCRYQNVDDLVLGPILTQGTP